ncbi:class I SAM-dependent methyltransferase [Aliikangiella maris]|uniref:Class I SAM-dependent methyltransferase n=2 Tax=Aliikangiella maris TaxID=3162458 RepID=A0ABV3MRW9_9GAMM
MNNLYFIGYEAAQQTSEQLTEKSPLANNEIVNNKIVQLAKQFDMTIVDSGFKPVANQIYFAYSHPWLSLYLELNGRVTRLQFDLAEGEVGFRAARVSKSNEVVAKAIGCKPHYRPKVFDATAGMGRDSLIMAMLGCEVIMHERSLPIYLLLENALNRLQQKWPDISACMHLENYDSLQVNEHWIRERKVDVVYLDPMFPERKKSALVKQEMRIFKVLAGEDADADQLMINTLKSGVKRVVVKRPKGAEHLASKKPNHEIIAKKFRYDVYLNH